jgi:Family of unknown function (DUF6580)
MSAFLLLLLAIVSRVMPHPGWLNFTAVGGSLLYFGARRPLRQALIPVVLLAGTDYYLTVYAYRYPFHLQDYLVTWIWYAAAILIGATILKSNASVGRVVGASVLSATSFFAISNFAVWAGSAMYPHTASGLAACYTAALPFYRNDLISTLVVTVLAFGTPVLASRLAESRSVHRPAAS